MQGVRVSPDVQSRDKPSFGFMSNEVSSERRVETAVARVAGEAAPLLFTALSNQFWTSDLSQPMASLPVTIFKFALSPYENWQKLAWAGVFLITLGVLVLNILARTLFRNRT